MKRIRTGIYLFVMLLSTCISFANGSYKAVHAQELFDFQSSDLTTHSFDPQNLESNNYRLSIDADKVFTFHTTFKRKQKTKFLIQHLNFSHYIKKPDRQFQLQDVHLIREFPEACPANNWLIRPAYYTFLFRLCPF